MKRRGTMKETPEKRSRTREVSEKRKRRTRDEMPVAEEKSMNMTPDLYSSLKLGLLEGQEKADKGLNFVFSPLSIRVAIGLLATVLDKGKDGRSQTSLIDLLSFLSLPTLDDLNTASNGLVTACRPSSNEDVLKILLANGVWVSDRSKNSDHNLFDTAKSIYKAIIEKVDFVNESDEIRREINDWIEEKTVGLIKNFLPQGIPDKRTLYVLANALYFKGNWEEGFDSSKSRDLDFFLFGNTTLQVPFMVDRYRRRQLFSKYDGFKSLVLPYQKDSAERSLSLIIFLPDQKDGMMDLMKKMASDPTFINNHIPQYKTSVYIKLPKFKISSQFEVSVDEIGLDSKRFKALHGATIEVDEEGTTAAATTTICRYYACVSRSPSPPPPEEFIADHPFIYAIREHHSGAVLFFGHVTNPLTG